MDLPQGIEVLSGVKSIGKAILFCVSLSTGLINKVLCHGIALQFSESINISKGDPILLQSNQYLSTFRPVNSIGVLAYFEKLDGKYVIGRVGISECFIERSFNCSTTKDNWLPPISIHSGRSYGFLCQICGDVSWFCNSSIDYQYPLVNNVDNRIQQCRKGPSMFSKDQEIFIRQQKHESIISRKKYFLNKDLSHKEYVLWRKLAPDFTMPSQNDKNAIFTQIQGEENHSVEMIIDKQIPDVTGLLAVPLLSNVILELNLLNSREEQLLTDGVLVCFVFVEREVLLQLFETFTHENKRSFFNNPQEADKFLLRLPKFTIVPLENIFDEQLQHDMIYMKYQGKTMGCFVNERGKNNKLKRLNDVTSVERLLSIKNDIKLSKASNERKSDSKKHIGIQVYSNMQQSDCPVPSPSRGPTEKIISSCGNVTFKLRYSYIRLGDPIAANRLCYNLSIISEVAAKIGRLLLICDRIGDRCYENWRYDMDIVTIDWFSGMHTDSRDKYEISSIKSHNDKIDKVRYLIDRLSTEELHSICKNKKLVWILNIWKRIIRLHTHNSNASTIKIERPNATTCTWFDIDTKRKRFIHTSDKEFHVVRYFLFPETGKCLNLHSGVCLSWYASKLQHGTSCTIVTDNKNKRVYYLGLSVQAPVTTIAWGESKPKNKEYLN